MSDFSLPNVVNILGVDHAVQWQTTEDMTGCTATVNIGRTFGSDEAAEDYAFGVIGGIDGVSAFRMTASGDVIMIVRP